MKNNYNTFFSFDWTGRKRGKIWLLNYFNTLNFEIYNYGKLNIIKRDRI